MATLLAMSCLQAAAQERDTLRLFDAVTFYDGYQFENNPDKDLQGRLYRRTGSQSVVDISEIANGCYLVNVELENGIISTRKVWIRR